MTAAQERLFMCSGRHAAKILPVGVRGAKNEKERKKANFSNDICQLCQNAKSSFSYRGLVPWNSFPAFLFNLNPAVVISFKNTDDNHFVGIHEKKVPYIFIINIIFLLLLL